MSNRLVRIGSALSRSVVGLSRSVEVCRELSSCRAVELDTILDAPSHAVRAPRQRPRQRLDGASTARQLDSQGSSRSRLLSTECFGLPDAVYTLEARRDVFLKPQRSVRSRRVRYWVAGTREHRNHARCVRH